MQRLKTPHLSENIIYETNIFHASAGHTDHACFPANPFAYG